MMYAKLALRNVKRSAKDYAIYFATLSLTATLLCAFLSLGFSSDIIGMTENMSMLTSGILALSVLVALIASFVIRYAVRFMLGQRKREFATYEILGMELRSIQRLFLIENILIGAGAFLIGIVLGSGLSGLLAIFVKSIFHTPHNYSVYFSLKAVLVTMLLFALMYGSGLIQAAKIIRRKKIIELLYDEKKNEKVKDKSIIRLVVSGVCTILEITAGVLLLVNGLKIQTNVAMLFLGGGAGLLLLAVYSIYRNLPFLLIGSVHRKKNYLLHGERLFLMGQLKQRFNSVGKTLAVITTLLTVSLLTMFAGLTMGAGYEANMEAYYPYDFGVAVDAPLTKESFDDVISFVDTQSTVEDSLTYYLYSAGTYGVEALSISDYNHLRYILGLEPKTLRQDRFLIHCDTWIYMEPIKSALSESATIELAGYKLQSSSEEIFTEPMEQYQMAGTKGYVIVVPDEVASQLPAEKIRLVCKLKDGGTPALKNDARTNLNSGKWKPTVQPGMEIPEHATLGITVKAWGIANSLTGYTTISFCGLYLSIVFIILSCTILAFEQLSRMETNRKHFQVIYRLGVDRQQQKRLIVQELSGFFVLPLIVPSIFLLFATIGFHKFFGEAILQANLIPLNAGITLLIFLVVYSVYFCATYFIYSRTVTAESHNSH